MVDIIAAFNRFYVSGRGIFRRQTASMESVELFLIKATESAIRNGAAEYLKLDTVITRLAKQQPLDQKLHDGLVSVRDELVARLNLKPAVAASPKVTPNYARLMEYVLEQTEQRDEDLEEFSSIISWLQSIAQARGIRLSRFSRIQPLSAEICTALDNLLQKFAPALSADAHVVANQDASANVPLLQAQAPTPIDKKDSSEHNLSVEPQPYHKLSSEQLTQLLALLPQAVVTTSSLREKLLRVQHLKQQLRVSEWLIEYYQRFDMQLQGCGREEVIALIDGLTPQEKLQYYYDEFKSAERIGYVKTNRFALSVIGISLVVGLGVLIPASAIPTFASALLGILSISWLPPVWLAAVTGLTIAIFAFAVAYWYNSTRTHTEYSDRHQRLIQRMNTENAGAVDEIIGAPKPQIPFAPFVGLVSPSTNAPGQQVAEHDKLSSVLDRIAASTLEQTVEDTFSVQQQEALGTPARKIGSRPSSNYADGSFTQILGQLQPGTILTFNTADADVSMRDGRTTITFRNPTGIQFHRPAPRSLSTAPALSPAPETQPAVLPSDSSATDADLGSNPAASPPGASS